MDDDEPLEPASDEPTIQTFLDGHWRSVIASARLVMEGLRDMVPEMAVHLPETGYKHLSAALRDAESLYASLHRAGPFVIGQDEYDSFLAAQTERRIG